MLTPKKAYEYLYSNRQLAERIVSDMRQKKTASDFEIDKAEAAIHYNHMEFSEAQVIYEHMLSSREVKADDQKMMEVLENLCDTYDALQNSPKLQQCIQQLYDKASKVGSKYYQSVALFLLGKGEFYEGDQADGIANVKKAIRLMEEADHPRRDHLLQSQLNVLCTMYAGTARFEDALSTMSQSEQFLRSKQPVNTEDLMIVLAKKTSMLVKMNRLAEADSVYEVWKALPKDADNPRQNFIIDYLRNRGRFSEALPIYEARLASIRESADTMNTMTYIMKWGMAETCYGLKQYQRAADLYLDVVNIGDSIQRLNAKASAQELAAVYKTKEKEQQIANQHFWLLLLTASLILLAVGALFWGWFTLRMRQKNRVMVKTIDELMTYRDLAYQQRPVTESPTTEEPTVNTIDAEHALFLDIDSKVVSRQLYCDPGFDRDWLIRVSGIEKNRLATIIRQYGGTNIPGYINSKRVEHAVSLMKQHPDYTLVAIAEACGFTNQTTFIRAFKNMFGITPSEYRQAKVLPPPSFD